MKLHIKIDRRADPLLAKTANLLRLTPEAVAEVAVYNFLACYLADSYGVEAANDFLGQVCSADSGVVRDVELPGPKVSH